MKEIGNTLYLLFLIIISGLSLLGCGWVLIDFIKQRHRAEFATKLLAILSISDAIYVIAVVAYPTPQTDGTFCAIQALFKQSSSVSTFIVIFFFCLTTFLTIVKNININHSNYDIYKRTAQIFSLLFPLLIALIPFIYNGYGKQSYACSFKIQNTFWIGELILFFIPFNFLSGACLYFLIQIKSFLRAIQTNNLDDDNKVNRRTFLSQNTQVNEGEYLTKFLFYYTFVHFLCWLPIIVNSILNIALQRNLVWFEGISYILACSQGFLDFIIYKISKQASSKVQYFERDDSILTLDHNDIYRGSNVYNSSL